ncbi:hypothetical protein A2483_05195 [Candidatus Peregrinibacteria bacterium RIFOXYC2_FULL_33_13]|nr:MAG: EamA-like protein transporter family [Candidatus Peregrinibacteria bacterium GW2011_GWA2_33_10]KKP38873.1 MAG: hypothetical protein UR30_C0014G0011 [Candidatus Peregrinibacteria bacterium GW2011_GWC2_33_13]OGJ54476.1 MAG: hypothetical protein A2483_05195 [Candidatus Peregrinibacteria bacterium RIFOXYC2_FULL_33_13]
MTAYLYIFGTIFLTVLGQIILKFGAHTFKKSPQNIQEFIPYIFKLLINPYFISAIFFAMIGSFLWTIALNKFELSFAYPFMSLSFILIVLLSSILFSEQVSLVRWIGVLTVCFGVFLISRS